MESESASIGNANQIVTSLVRHVSDCSEICCGKTMVAYTKLQQVVGFRHARRK